MSNLTAMMTNVRTKGHTAIMAKNCHIYKYERGGSAAFGGIFPHALDNLPDGTMDLKKIEATIPVDNVHLAMPSVICLENSQGCCNGAAIKLDYVNQVRDIADRHKLNMHLDGARLLNALIATGDEPAAYAKPFDTLSFCFSKGMGCPVGSVLVGDAENMAFAKNIRKMLGGGMRQCGILAACM